MLGHANKKIGATNPEYQKWKSGNASPQRKIEQVQRTPTSSPPPSAKRGSYPSPSSSRTHSNTSYINDLFRGKGDVSSMSLDLSNLVRTYLYEHLANRIGSNHPFLIHKMKTNGTKITRIMIAAPTSRLMMSSGLSKADPQHNPKRRARTSMLKRCAIYRYLSYFV